MKRALAAFNIDYVHLGKDVFLFPYYICKKYGFTLDVVTAATESNANLPKAYHGANIIRIENKKQKNKDAVLTDYIKQHAAEYDFLILFHYRLLTVFRCRLFKKQNPHGQVYVKFDMGIGTWKDNYEVKGIKRLLKKWQLSQFEKYCDMFSVESTPIYENIKKNWSNKLTISSRFALVPNGFDEEELQSTGIKIKSYNEKQNLLITVGRAGSYPKNTEFLLCFLDKIKLHDWKVKIIGPYTEEIFSQYKLLCEKNPDFADKVEFVGNITDKAKLFSYYNDAKIFVLPSRSESFSLVLTEAMRFGNYVITSPIISANDLTQNGKTGSIVPLELDAWISEIQKFIDNDSEIRKKFPEIIEYSKANFSMEQIVEKTEIFKQLGGECE